MARITYVEERDHPELAEEIGKIKGGRGGVINIYKLLLNSPPVAMSWLQHSNSTGWYPHTRLCRQQTAGDWDSALTQAAQWLQTL